MLETRTKYFHSSALVWAWLFAQLDSFATHLGQYHRRLASSSCSPYVSPSTCPHAPFPLAVIGNRPLRLSEVTMHITLGKLQERRFARANILRSGVYSDCSSPREATSLQLQCHRECTISCLRCHRAGLIFESEKARSHLLRVESSDAFVHSAHRFPYHNGGFARVWRPEVLMSMR